MTYIIAEAGVNHDGNINKAFKLIDEAKNAGADCVKFQTFKASEIATKNAPKAKYQLKVTSKHESQIEMLEKLELDSSSFKKLKTYCDEIKIDFMSTPYNFQDIDLLESIGVTCYKVASAQLVELPFLEYLASKKKPIILSTGMGTMFEVYQAIQTIRKYSEAELSVLQCTTNYPSKIEDSNILSMVRFKELFNVEVGYSDHVPENYASYAAVALGAKIVEKHFTINKNDPGPDHSSSLEPSEFKEFVDGIRKVELSLGNSSKIPSQAELVNLHGMRRSLVAIHKITKGQIVKATDLGFKRPNNGLSINLYNEVIGKKASKNIESDQPLKFDDLEW